MSDGFESPDDAATVVLTAVVARVTALSDRLGVPHAQVFDTGRLSVASGVPEPVVKTLLSGRPASAHRLAQGAVEVVGPCRGVELQLRHQLAAEAAHVLTDAHTCLPDQDSGRLTLSRSMSSHSATLSRCWSVGS